MYRILLHTKHLRLRLLKKSSPARKLEVIHLRIFGCPVYIQIPKEKRTKLDPSGSKGIFVGYSESSKAYRIYFPIFKKIQPTSNPERNLLKNMKKQKLPEFMIQS